MRTRRRFIIALGASLLAVSIAAPAQRSGKVYRIGFLGARSRSTPAHPDIYYDAWLRAMRDLGYAEGKNLVIEWRFADGNYERVPGLAAELAGMKLDIIVTHALPPTLGLQRATSTIPIVFLVIVDPVGNRVVPSLARPGGNTTGMSLMSEDVNAKRVELLKELIPALSRVAVLVNPDNPSHPAMLKKIKGAATVLGLSAGPVEARNLEDIERALDASLRERADALILLEDGAFVAYQNRIAESAFRRRIPSMSWMPEFVESGGLISYGMNLLDCYRRGATLVDKILKGAKPADLPIEQPTKIDLVINRKTAKALGITIPPELLVQADRVIE